MNYILQRF